MKQTTKVGAVALFAAFVLALVLVSSTNPGIKLRGGSPSGNGILRDAQLFTSFPGFVSFLLSLLRRIVAWILSLPTAIFQSIISWFFFVWNFVFGALLSLSSPFVTTTTTTLAPMTTTSVLTSMEPVTSVMTSTPISSMSLPQTTATSVLTSSESMASSTAATSASSETSMLSSTSSTPVVAAASSSSSTATTTASSSTSEMTTTSTSFSTTTTTTLPTTTTTTATMTTTLKPCKTVFITSQGFTGNLGGLEGADMKCSEAATAANVSGMFKAWLSNATECPNTRFTRSTLPYELIGGTRFADSYASLVGSGALSVINIQEDGQPTSSNQIWTGTGSNGNLVTPTCSDWTSTSGNAIYGSNSLALFWSILPADTLLCNNGIGRIYCFEQ